MLKGEVRPCNALHIVVLHCNTDAGVPSDHAVMAGAATVGLWLVQRQLGVLAVLAAAVMGFARVYVGAHYPQDVLAGACARRGGEPGRLCADALGIAVAARCRGSQPAAALIAAQTVREALCTLSFKWA